METINKKIGTLISRVKWLMRPSAKRPRLGDNTPLRALKDAQVNYLEQQLGLKVGDLKGLVKCNCEALNKLVNKV